MFIPLRDSISSKRFPFVNWALIFGNVTLFVYQLGLGPEKLQPFVYQWGVIPALFNLGDVPLSQVTAELPRLFSSMFMHGGIMHLLGNMLMLWIFGDNVEDRLGAFRYLLFYLLCGLAASGSQILMNPASQIPMIGASGAIGGVMGAYFVSYPKSYVDTIFVFFFFIRRAWLPAVTYLGLWFALNLLLALSTPTGAPGVAFWAHIGGFGMGLVLILVFGRKRPKRGQRREQRRERRVVRAR